MQAVNPLEYFVKFHAEKRYMGEGLLESLDKCYSDCCYQLDEEKGTVTTWCHTSLEWNPETNDVEEYSGWEETEPLDRFFKEYFSRELGKALQRVIENASINQTGFTSGSLKDFFHTLYNDRSQRKTKAYWLVMLEIVGTIAAKAYHYDRDPETRNIVDLVVGYLSENGINKSFDPAYEGEKPWLHDKDVKTDTLEHSIEHKVRFKVGKTSRDLLKELQDTSFVDKNCSKESFDAMINGIDVEKKIVWTDKASRSKYICIQSMICLVHQLFYKSTEKEDIKLDDIRPIISKYFTKEAKESEEITFSSSHLRDYKRGKKIQKYEKDLIDIVAKYVDFSDVS